MLEFKNLKNEDPEIYEAIAKEKKRQQDNLEMIASENFTSEAVMEAMGSYMTNKYAEGYPGNRYYAGCQNVDVSETIAIERLKKLFGAEHANVQPHSGAQANEAVYTACLQPGDKVLTLTLNSGGHISHMSKATAQSRFYEPIYYDVNPETYVIDYDEVERLALENKPKLIITGASAYPRTIDFKRFREIADKCGALLMVDMAHIAGLVAAGVHPSPVPYADFVTSTTHKTLRGPRGGIILCKEEWAKQIDLAVFPRTQGGPLEHVIAGKAVAFKEALSPEFKEYQKQIVANAKVLAERLIENGFNVLTGGTDNHLVLLDLRNKEITGKDLETRLDSVRITTNKNAVPFDTENKKTTSGLRLGTPALTTRGMKEEQMVKIADLIKLCADSEEYMKINIIASTKVGYELPKEEAVNFSGKSAGICYLPDTLDVLFNEPIEKTEKRAQMNIQSGHHSVFGHATYNLSLEGIPKILAMILNNEKVYNTSEKSARYTVMQTSDEEQELYDKWIEIYKKRITEEYPNFDECKIFNICIHTCNSNGIFYQFLPIKLYN